MMMRSLWIAKLAIGVSGASATSAAAKKKRFRTIRKMPEYGGKACPMTDYEQDGHCDTRHCRPTFWCAWNDWEPWGACSTTCGNGIQNRHRNLTYGEKHQGWVTESWPNSPAWLQDYEVLELRAAKASRFRIRDMGFAFALGCISIMAVLGTTRAGRSIMGQFAQDHSTPVSDTHDDVGPPMSSRTVSLMVAAQE